MTSHCKLILNAEVEWNHIRNKRRISFDNYFSIHIEMLSMCTALLKLGSRLCYEFLLF